MSNETKKYQTIAEADYTNVTLIADPEVIKVPVWRDGKDTGKKERRLRVKFYKSTRNKRAVDVPIEVTPSLEYRPWLEKLRKGDRIARVAGFEDTRLYASNAKTAFNGVGVAGEIRNPRIFEVGVDLRERPEPGKPEESQDGAAGGGEGTSQGGTFFGDE